MALGWAGASTIPQQHPVRGPSSPRGQWSSSTAQGSCMNGAIVILCQPTVLIIKPFQLTWNIAGKKRNSYRLTHCVRPAHPAIQKHLPCTLFLSFSFFCSNVPSELKKGRAFYWGKPSSFIFTTNIGESQSSYREC